VTRTGTCRAGFAACAALLPLAFSAELRNDTPVRVASWEAEEVVTLRAPFERVADPQASGSGFVALYPGPGEGVLHYEFEVEEAGSYTLWARVRWENSCRNSVMLSFNGESPSLFGNDSHYQQWHWVSGGPYALRRGRNQLTVRDFYPFEDHVMPLGIDRFVVGKGIDAAALGGNEAQRRGVRLGRFFPDWERDWIRLSGRWQAETTRSASHLRQTSEETAMVLLRDRDWRRYAIEAALRTGRAGTLGLVYDHAGAGDYALARVVVPRSVVQLVRVRAGEERVLAEQPIALAESAWLRLGVERGASSTNLLVDGTRVLELRARAPRDASAQPPDAKVGRGVGLYSEGTAEAVFDDLRVRALDAERPADDGARPPVVVAQYRFDSPPSASEWYGSAGWGASGGPAAGSSPPPPLVHREPVIGAFQIEAELRLAPRSVLALWFGEPAGELAVYVDTRAPGTKVILAEGDRPLGGVHLPARRALRLLVDRSEDRAVVSVDGRAAIETARERRPERIAVHPQQGRAALGSLHVRARPSYAFDPWAPPVGWAAARGRVAVGHQFLSGSAPDGDALLWHRRPFSCRAQRTDAVLAVRGDAAPGAHVDLIVCGDGGAETSGLILRAELAGESTPFAEQRAVHLLLRSRGRVLARDTVRRPVHETGFVPVELTLQLHDGVASVREGGKLLFRVAWAPPREQGRLGLRFDAKRPQSHDQLALGRLRVFD